MNWQPIETAPKDGTRVVVWVADARDPQTLLTTGSAAFGRTYDGRAYADGFNGDWLITHWMPLPAPPK